MKMKWSVLFIKRRIKSQTCLALVSITDNVPVQGNGHVAPPDGVPAQDNGPGDAIADIQADWLVQHEQGLLPVCRPDGKDQFSIILIYISSGSQHQG